jgi:hypothetical protein
MIEGKKQVRTARKDYKCEAMGIFGRSLVVESCEMPIRPGETYLEISDSLTGVTRYCMVCAARKKLCAFDAPAGPVGG